MFTKALLVTSELVVRPFIKNDGSVGVKFAKVSGEAPHRNVAKA
jgi:hypothetical protein